jgi:hypothetical protein
MQLFKFLYSRSITITKFICNRSQSVSSSVDFFCNYFGIALLYLVVMSHHVDLRVKYFHSCLRCRCARSILYRPSRYHSVMYPKQPQLPHPFLNVGHFLNKWGVPHLWQSYSIPLLSCSLLSRWLLSLFRLPFWTASIAIVSDWFIFLYWASVISDNLHCASACKRSHLSSANKRFCSSRLPVHSLTRQTRTFLSEAWF